MSFLFPLGMAALAMLVPLVVLYLLKQKREEHRIPASFLWQHALEDLRASSLFQRLRTPLLFFLQAAAVILFGLAAAGASLDSDAGDAPRRVILVVDRSRSMQAADEDDRTRMEVAKELCRDAVDGLRGSDELEFEFAGPVELGEHRGIRGARVGADHLAHAFVFDQRGQADVATPGVVVHHREVLRALIDEGVDEFNRAAGFAEAPDHHRRAVVDVRDRFG